MWNRFHKTFYAMHIFCSVFSFCKYTNVALDLVIDFTMHGWVETSYSLENRENSWERDYCWHFCCKSKEKLYCVLLYINLTYIPSLSFISLLWNWVEFLSWCFWAESSFLGAWHTFISWLAVIGLSLSQTRLGEKPGAALLPVSYCLWPEMHWKEVILMMTTPGNLGFHVEIWDEPSVASI